jgi:hypothetical protein
VPTLQTPSQAVKQWQQYIKLCFEPGLGNQDSPFSDYCVVFTNIQEEILQYYDITVVPVQSIEAHRGGGIAPLILKVGTDGTSGQLHALAACFTPHEKRPVGYSLDGKLRGFQSRCERFGETSLAQEENRITTPLLSRQ